MRGASRQGQPDFNSRPSARGDKDGRGNPHSTRHFNSRPSARGDRMTRCISSFASSFQFTPLREGRLPRMDGRRSAGNFNSRPSARGDALLICSHELDIIISIHAPPRGATRIRHFFWCRLSHFNSRPSARGDRPSSLSLSLTIDISIHAPPRGATFVFFVAPHKPVFQFTPLREGRQSH